MTSFDMPFGQRKLRPRPGRTAPGTSLRLMSLRLRRLEMTAAWDWFLSGSISTMHLTTALTLKRSLPFGYSTVRSISI
jgi:hypothetical protein